MATVADINALLARGAAATAMKQAQALARRKSSDPHVLDLLARCYSATRDHKKALTTYDRLIRLRPKAAKPLADKAHLLQLTGDLGRAKASLHKALKLAPLNGSLLRMLSQSGRVAKDDPAVLRILQAWREDTLADADKIEAGFALFKIFGADGFAYLAEANRLQYQKHPWSLAERKAETTRLRAALEATPWPAISAPNTNRMPIFVTGMPRSGTTLVEQILSSHPKVGATGETGLPLRAAYSVIADKEKFCPISSLSGDDLGLIGRRYLDGIDHFHAPGPVFTDKSIQTYMVMGLMQHVVPGARTIVVRRDPRDIGWSIYRNHFADGTHSYASDLTSIAEMIHLMQEMVEFWRMRRPKTFLEVRYEDLVRDPEPEIRKMLDYCGLQWDAACLAPEKNTGMVKTLSVEQVRAPISPKSIGGWRAFSDQLKPLVSALGSSVDEWD